MIQQCGYVSRFPSLAARRTTDNATSATTNPERSRVLLLENVAFDPPCFNPSDRSSRAYAPVHRERQFQAAYRRELRETPNIHTARWQGLGHQRFGDLARKAIGLVFPSSAEGQAQEVVAGMAAGLIPIVTREAGVDVEGFGGVLPSSSPADVSKAVRDLSALPVTRLGEMAERAWHCARSRHAPDVVARRLDEILQEVLTDPQTAG